ncbi:MAG: hypothetical protein NXY57DRAFT_962369 [Lentinula lateritia]|uniref:Uncharacterized protein n=1 Tax=Lentinula lateritia TaxID=40482 RepID=A0ABQ8VXX1_9AGAR|nr:MAG: hypothetical protein NXY57DRAFT_962369 [Lentinula lateritia]KAJ4501181.1 hypothetical protein C8R41DRAFT_913176 [Lentinula lateritia]
MSSLMPPSATTASSPTHLSSPDNEAMQVIYRPPGRPPRFVGLRRNSGEVPRLAHDPKDQRFEAMTERIQSQCNFLASVFSLERRVYGVKAAYYTVLVVIEDNQPLPAFMSSMVFRWTCDTSSTKPPSPPNNYTHAGTLITLIPSTIAPEFIPSTNSPESTTPSSTSPSPSSTFTAGAFLRDKHNPS